MTGDGEVLSVRVPKGLQGWIVATSWGFGIFVIVILVGILCIELLAVKPFGGWFVNNFKEIAIISGLVAAPVVAASRWAMGRIMDGQRREALAVEDFMVGHLDNIRKDLTEIKEIKQKVESMESTLKDTARMTMRLWGRQKTIEGYIAGKAHAPMPPEDEEDEPS